MESVIRPLPTASLSRRDFPDITKQPRKILNVFSYIPYAASPLFRAARLRRILSLDTYVPCLNQPACQSAMTLG
jgi:hypothetical protein